MCTSRKWSVLLQCFSFQREQGLDSGAGNHNRIIGAAHVIDVQIAAVWRYCRSFFGVGIKLDDPEFGPARHSRPNATDEFGSFRLISSDCITADEQPPC